MLSRNTLIIESFRFQGSIVVALHSNCSHIYHYLHVYMGAVILHMYRYFSSECVRFFAFHFIDMWLFYNVIVCACEWARTLESRIPKQFDNRNENIAKNKHSDKRHSACVHTHRFRCHSSKYTPQKM